MLRNLGDYNPPVMIDTVMGVLDEESRDVLMEEYFPSLADQIYPTLHHFGNPQGQRL